MVSAPLDVDLREPLSSPTTLEIAEVSVQGKLRAYNADHYLAFKITRGLETVVTSLAETDRPPLFEEYGHALFVADGSGSQGLGTYASRAALSHLEYVAIQYGKWQLRVDKKTAADIERQIQGLYRLVDDALRQASAKLPGTSLRTSLTTIALAGADLVGASIGNSKAFLFREGELVLLTTDRTRVERRLGGIGEGGAGDMSVEVEHSNMMAGDRLLLCTNGLTDFVSEPEIADALALRRRPDDDCKHLVDLAVLIGGTDDITAMVADYRTASNGRL